MAKVSLSPAHSNVPFAKVLLIQVANSVVVAAAVAAIAEAVKIA